MNLEDKYRRLRTDMEDMIEAHKENVKVWNVLKLHYESQQLVVPSVDLPTMVQILLNPTQP
jgi:hypothetical protein